MPQFGMPMSKSKDILPDSNSWWKYDFDIEVKGQGHTDFMIVRVTSYHDDTLTCQTKYNYFKGQKAESLTQSHVINPINLTLRSKFKVVSGSWMYLTHLLIVIGMFQIWYANVKANRSYWSDMKTWQKPINLTLRSKVNIKSGSWIYATHRLMVKDPCAKYGNQCQSKKKVWSGHENNLKNPINLTWRLKFKVVSGSWIYATHRLMVIHPCAKYGKLMFS